MCYCDSSYMCLLMNTTGELQTTEAPIEAPGAAVLLERYSPGELASHTHTHTLLLSSGSLLRYHGTIPLAKKAVLSGIINAHSNGSLQHWASRTTPATPTVPKQWSWCVCVSLLGSPFRERAGKSHRGVLKSASSDSLKMHGAFEALANIVHEGWNVQ